MGLSFSMPIAKLLTVKTKAARVRKSIPLLLFAAIAPLLMLKAFEHSQVYHPSRDSEYAVTDVHPDGEDLFLQSSDGVKIHAWFIPGKKNSPNREFVFLFCHGNGGNLTGRPPAYRALMATGASVMAFDYRGYGKSDGEPAEEGTYQDAFAAYDWLIERGVKPDHIISWGESLGGGIASKIAHTKHIGALVLQSTFTSIPDIGAELFPFLPVKLIASIEYHTNERMKEIDCPVVVMHGKDDEIIPYHHGRKNFEDANEPKRFMELDGGHNDTIFVNEKKYIAGAEAALELAKAAK